MGFTVNVTRSTACVMSESTVVSVELDDKAQPMTSSSTLVSIQWGLPGDSTETLYCCLHNAQLFMRHESITGRTSWSDSRRPGVADSHVGHHIHWLWSVMLPVFVETCWTVGFCGCGNLDRYWVWSTTLIHCRRLKRHPVKFSALRPTDFCVEIEVVAKI